jgi:hypothetical protein
MLDQGIRRKFLLILSQTKVHHQHVFQIIPVLFVVISVALNLQLVPSPSRNRAAESMAKSSFQVTLFPYLFILANCTRDFYSVEVALLIFLPKGVVLFAVASSQMLISFYETYFQITPFNDLLRSSSSSINGRVEYPTG